jgi:hypothetical protein
MLSSFRKHFRSIAMIGVASALVVGGVAAAQGGSHGGRSHHRAGPPSGKRMPPPPPGGPLGKNLTYAQFHVQRNGQEVVVRLDRGKVDSVSDSSITLTENDGSQVTIPVDSSTKVLAGPGHKVAVTDLKAGRQVLVCGPDGGTAKAIIVPPKPGKRPHGPIGSQRRGQMPPPPGAPFGAPQGGPQAGGN